MPNQLLTDTLNATGKFFESSFETPIEQEILLADYDPAVFKIVKTLAEHTITQKYINGNKIILEGYFKLSVFYQPPGESVITVISKKLPFGKQFDLTKPGTSPYFITVDGEPQYINTRAINSTRIDVRGAYRLSIKAYCATEQSVATAVNSTTVCCDSDELGYFTLMGRGSRQFSAEDELPLPDNADKILDVTYKNNNMSVSVYRDKVNVKGEISAEVIYTQKDSDDIYKIGKTFPYNQIVDINGITENNAAYPRLSVLNFTITQNPDTNKINCIVSRILEVKVFRKESVILLTDAFSKEYEYRAEKTTFSYDENLETVSKTAQFTVEDAVGIGYTVAHCFAHVSTPFIAQSDNGPVLKSKLNVSVLVKNTQGEFECFTKSGDIVHEGFGPINPDYEYLLTCKTNDAEAVITDDLMKAKVSVFTEGVIIKRNTVSTLDNFEENTEVPVERQRNALILYYAHKGEKVFDISMKYKTDTALILSENEIETGELKEDRMLFIPAFGR